MRLNRIMQHVWFCFPEYKVTYNEERTYVVAPPRQEFIIDSLAMLENPKVVDVKTTKDKHIFTVRHYTKQGKCNAFNRNLKKI
jgi:hypothetical protein